VATAATVAGYCDSFPTIVQELKASPVVIVGTVRAARAVVASDGYVRGTFYSVQIAQVLKGSRSDTLELYSENSSGRFPMRVGVRYFIFAHREGFEGVEGRHLAINSCGNSASLPKGDKALATVRKLTKAWPGDATAPRF
jgi:hypothetical protein